MSWINKASALLLAAVLMAVSASAETLIDPSAISSAGANYKTTEVTLGDYSRSVQTSAKLWYPLEYKVKYEGMTARFDRFLVKRGDKVKKGDRLAAFIAEPDEAGIYEKELRLARAEESFRAQISGFDSRIASLTQSMEAETDPCAKEDLRLQMEIAKKEKQLYEMDAQKELTALERELENLKAAREMQYVYAPQDGTVTELTYLRSREQVTSGTQIAVLTDKNEVRFVLEDSEGLLKMGMPVTIELGSNTERLTAVGRVVACDRVQPGALSSRTAIVEVEAFRGAVPENLTRPVASFVPVYVTGVPMAAAAAMTLENGRYFVYKLTADGGVSKRPVVYVASENGRESWILSGAEVGETLIVN